MKTKLMTLGGIIAFYLFIILSVMSINSRLGTINNYSNHLEKVNVAYNH